MGDLPAVLGAVAALWATFIAQRGLNTWREQLRGSVEYDLARRSLKHIYELRDAVAGVRNSFISGGEFALARKDAGKQPDPTQVGASPEDMSLVYDRRWSHVSTARRELAVDVLEMEVVWGSSVLEARQLLDRALIDLQFAIGQHLRGLASRREPTEKEYERQRKFEAILWGDAETGDEFGVRFAKAVEGFELLLRPHLSTTTRRRYAVALRKASQ